MKVHIIKFVLLGIMGWKAAVVLVSPEDNSVVLNKVAAIW